MLHLLCLSTIIPCTISVFVCAQLKRLLHISFVNSWPLTTLYCIHSQQYVFYEHITIAVAVAAAAAATAIVQLAVSTAALQLQPLNSCLRQQSRQHVTPHCSYKESSTSVLLFMPLLLCSCSC
jgi:hypothetical protein